MAFHYSDPARESLPYALPNVEVYQAAAFNVYCESCDLTYQAYIPIGAGWIDVRPVCPECAHEQRSQFHDFVTPIADPVWFWQACYPGCLPDGDAIGPFETQAAAIDDATDTDTEGA